MCSICYQPSINCVILLLYDVLCLPSLCFPFNFPWIAHFTSSRTSAISVIVWPKKERLRFTTIPKGFFGLFGVQSSWLVTSDGRRWSTATVMLIRSLSRQLWSESSILCHTWELLTSVSDLISFLGLVHSAVSPGMYYRSSIILLVIPIWALVSLRYNCHQLISATRYIWTVDHLLLFTIHYNFCIGLYFQIFKSLVCFIFTSNSFAFTVLLTFPISLSASSCDSSQIAVSSACLRFKANFRLPISSFFACRSTRLNVKIEEI